MNELHFMIFRNKPIVLLSTNRDKKGLFSGWLFLIDKDGYTKHYSHEIDLINFYPIDKFTLKNVKRNFIVKVLFNQLTEYKRDEILNTLLQINRVIE